MGDLLIGVLGLGAVLALAAAVTCLIVVSRKQRQRVWAREEQRRSRAGGGCYPASNRWI